MHSFDKTQLADFLRKACRIHKEFPGTEICGLLVDTGFHLSLVQVRNISRRPGSFVFSRRDVCDIVGATKVLGQEIVGTFHSHPVAPAVPGKSDIENAVNNSLMLILDCMDCRARLWKIRNGKTRELDFLMLG